MFLRRRRRVPASSGFNWSLYMRTKLFDTVVIYATPATTDINPPAAEDVQIDLASIGNTVTVHLPLSGFEGQCIGVCLRSALSGAAVIVEPALSVSFATRLVAAGDCLLYTWNATGSFWELVTKYLAVISWADAAERNATPVDTTMHGRVGIQADINLPYELLDAGPPARWAPLDDPSMGCPRPHAAQNSTTTVVGLSQMSATVGTLANRTQANTNALTRLCRVAITSAAAAGSSLQYRNGSTQGIAFVNGFRYRTQFGFVNPSASCWWFAGISNTVTVNVDPVTFLNCIGVGRSAADANVQLFHNDGAGNATKVDLGASFPAATANLAYELELYTFDGSAFGYQLTNLDSGAQISGSVSTNLPILTPIVGSPVYYAANNLDAVALEFAYANQQNWSRVY